MRGLVYKDFKTVLSQYIVVFGLLALYVGATVFFIKSLGFFASMEPVLMMVTAMLAFGYDEKSGFNAYVRTLPISTAQIVRARYLFALIMIVFTAVLHVGVTFALGTPWAESLESLAFGSSLSLLFAAVMFPVLYSLGSDKSRVVFMFLFFGMLVLGSRGDYIVHLGTAASIGLFAASCVLVCVSSAFSVRLLDRRSFA